MPRRSKKRERKRGDGQVRYLASRDRFQVSYQIDTPQGRRQVRALYRTEDEAFRAIEERTVAARSGTHGEALTLADWMKDPRLQLREEVRRTVEREFAGLYGRKLSTITKGDLLRAQTRLAERGLSNDSVNDYLRAFLIVLSRAEEDRILPHAPTLPRSKWLPQTVNRLELTDAERAALYGVFQSRPRFAKTLSPNASRLDVELAWIRHLRFRRVFTLALETGLARKDLLSLRWSQIDTKSAVLTGKRAKTGQAYAVPLTPLALDVLREIRRDKLQTERVLSTAQGNPYTAMMLRDGFERMKACAGIKRRLRWHDLRFSFGQRLADAGLSDVMIARTMGHSPASRMPRRYAQPTDDVQLARAREALSR